MREMLDSVLLHGAAELITTLGGDAQQIALRADVPRIALKDAGVPVLGYAMTDFFEIAAETCQCRSFGAQMAMRSGLAVVGPIWPLLETAETIGQMVDDLVTHFSIYSEAAVIGLDHSADGVLMSFESRAGHCESEVQMMEYSLGITCAELRRHCAASWQPATVQFRHRAPIGWAHHLALFGPNLMFEQDRNAIFIDTTTLSQRRVTPKVDARYALEAEMRALREVQSHSIIAQVETVIRARGDLAAMTIETVSAKLSMSQRSLQRQLTQAGSSFSKILETVRADLALKYVRQTQLSLGQIAEILGYSELSAFTRAFRRWHGQTAISIRRNTELGSHYLRDTFLRPHPDHGGSLNDTP